MESDEPVGYMLMIMIISLNGAEDCPVNLYSGLTATINAF